MSGPGPLIASGRDADIFACGPGVVLRRTRTGRPLDGEAHVMRLAHDAGYPVPRVHEVSDDGRDLIMDRIDGPTLLDDLATHPWKLKRNADILAGLLSDLHSITIGPDVSLRPAPTGAGPTLIHLDLHPLNVLVSPAGPMVIDWANAAAGVAAVDVAVTWSVVASGEIPGNPVTATLARMLRDRFVDRLIGHFDLDVLRTHLPVAVDWKAADTNLSDGERSAMRELVRVNRR